MKNWRGLAKAILLIGLRMSNLSAMAGPTDVGVDFYPVMHLLTGPPGLTRNGGIWKGIKSLLSSTLNPPRLMVQALHLASYDLSRSAWYEWSAKYRSTTRLAAELEKTFGASRDIFVDSGGFQLLHSARIDLAKWGLDLNPEGIFALQSKFGPKKVASLDSPLPPNATGNQISELMKMSVRNSQWLINHSENSGKGPIPYLVAHGRNPNELRRFLDRLERILPKQSALRHEYGVALGSQVQLSGRPDIVRDNCQTILRWMHRVCPEAAPFHVFGIGEGLAGLVARLPERSRSMSFDNSTWVQNSFRMRFFDAQNGAYVDFDPRRVRSCRCEGCRKLSNIGSRLVSEVLRRPPYRPYLKGDVRINRSDILALIAIHNLFHWRQRLATAPARMKTHSNGAKTSGRGAQSPTTYRFPLNGYRALSPTLLLLPCSKARPYGLSRSHQKVLSRLSKLGRVEGRDFDRISLSGLFGPVHWRHERHPAIMRYDFQLPTFASEEHSQHLQYRTSMVLRVVGRKYVSVIAYIPSKAYSSVFGPVALQFGIPVVKKVDDIDRYIHVPDGPFSESAALPQEQVLGARSLRRS